MEKNKTGEGGGEMLTRSDDARSGQTGQDLRTEKGEDGVWIPGGGERKVWESGRGVHLAEALG